MNSSCLTETDILKALVRKGSFTDVCRELNAPSCAGESAEAVQREQLR